MRNERLLIVESMDCFYELMRYNLSKRGYTVERARSERDVKEAAARVKPHLAIVDHNLEFGNALAACRLIRENAPPARPRFIIISPIITKDLLRQAVGLGIENFLVEPFTLRDLLEKIERVLGSEMNLEIVKLTGKIVISLKGTLDQNFAIPLRQALDDLLSTGHTNIIIDYSDVDFFAHQNLVALLSAKARVDFLQGKISVVGLNEGLKKLFSRAGLDDVFTYYETRAEAIRLA